MPRYARADTAAAVAAAIEDGAEGIVVAVRRTPGGALVCSREPLGDGDAAETLDAVLAATGDAPTVCEVRNVPGEPDFDAPACATAHLLVAALRGRDVVVASEDWHAIEVARDAGLRTAFVPPEGVALDAALAYVTEARHAACLVPANDGLRWVESQTTTDSASGTERNVSDSTSPR